MDDAIHPLQISIPPDMLSQQPLLLVLIILAVPAVWALVTKLLDRHLDRRAATRDAEAKALKDATEVAIEHRILNERAAARIDLLTYQRDEAIKDADRCERALERLRYPTPPESHP